MSDSELDSHDEGALTYIDNNSCEYEIDSSYAEGDIVLLTDPNDDAMAFKVDKASLAFVSPVFRDMFSGPYDGPDIRLNTPGTTLKPFLIFLTRPHTYRSPWSTTLRVIDFAKRYQCDNYVSNLLFHASSKDPGKDRFEAFVQVAQCNNMMAACRLLRRGASGEMADKEGKSLRPNSEGWTAGDVARFSPQWIWALSCALQWADGILFTTPTASTLHRRRDDYWKAVVGEFMVRMLT